MIKIKCESNWAGSCILKAASLDEHLYISYNDCALICDMDTFEQGYAMYLFVPSEADSPYTFDLSMNSDITYCLLPQVSIIEPGHFLEIVGDGQEAIITVLPTDDLPDRTLFLTGQCNSNCVMCPYTTNWRIKAEHTSYQLLLRYIELMNPFAPYLCITGGEPTLLKENFFEILSRVKAHFESCLVHILTNGRAFYYEDFFDSYRAVRPINTLLGIPIYGHNQELHNSITQSNGSFEETIKGLNRLYASGEHIELRIVLTAINAPYLQNICQYIYQNYPNVYMVSIMGLEMMGNAYVNREQVWINYDDIAGAFSNSIDYLVTHGIQTQIYNLPLCKVEQRYWPLCQKSISPEKVSFFPECDQCAVLDVCGGFFFTTMKMPDVRVMPIMEAE